MAPGSDHSERRAALLTRAWNEAAAGYDAYFSARFAPWIHVAIEGLRSIDYPDGALLVPCSGPGRELALLGRQYPKRRIVGIDASEGMHKIAAQICAPFANVELKQLDAAALESLQIQAAGVVSCFGLQQLSDPAKTLTIWTRVLRPKGALSVIFWPAQCEDSGPFAAQRELLAEQVKSESRAWETELRRAIEAGGGQLIQDSEIRFPMIHDSAEAVWNALVESGPLRALYLSRGADVMNELRARFIARLPPGQIEHRPRARLLVAQRT